MRARRRPMIDESGEGRLSALNLKETWPPRGGTKDRKAAIMSLTLVASAAAVASFAGAMVYSALRDVLTMQVSDRVVLMLLGLFPILAPLSGWTLESMLLSTALAMIVFFASVGFFALGWMGGGDGKLITVSVLWLGTDQTVGFIFYTALVGGLCTACLLGFRRLALPLVWQSKAWIVRLHRPENGAPYAVAIGSAGLIVLPHTLWLKDFV